MVNASIDDGADGGGRRHLAGSGPALSATVPAGAVERFEAEPRPEIVPLAGGFRIGRGGWYVLDEAGGEVFRWVNNDAEIVVTDPGARVLALDLEPGPALRGKPLRLTAASPEAGELGRFVIDARRRIELTLPARSAPYAILLRVDDGGAPLPGAPRTLNFRAFHIPRT